MVLCIVLWRSVCVNQAMICALALRRCQSQLSRLMDSACIAMVLHVPYRMLRMYGVPRTQYRIFKKTFHVRHISTEFYHFYETMIDSLHPIPTLLWPTRALPHVEPASSAIHKTGASKP